MLLFIPGIDNTGQRLSCELLLLLAAQRGSLRHLLQWVETALTACGQKQLSNEKQSTGRKLKCHKYVVFNI